MAGWTTRLAVVIFLVVGFAVVFPKFNSVHAITNNGCSLRLTTDSIYLRNQSLEFNVYYLTIKYLDENNNPQPFKKYQVDVPSQGIEAALPLSSLPSQDLMIVEILDSNGNLRCNLGVQISDHGSYINASQASFDYCKQVPDGPQRQACLTCVNGREGKVVFTGVGCIEVSGSGLASDLIKIIISVAGMSSFLAILLAAFLFTVSKGESSKVKQSQELITAAVSGLLFIIFSVVILNFIGVEILAIPGLG